MATRCLVSGVRSGCQGSVARNVVIPSGTNLLVGVWAPLKSCCCSFDMVSLAMVRTPSLKECSCCLSDGRDAAGLFVGFIGDRLPASLYRMYISNQVNPMASSGAMEASPSKTGGSAIPTAGQKGSRHRSSLGPVGLRYMGMLSMKLCMAGVAGCLS